MAVNTVQANINGQNYTLTYNGTSGKWEATITAPSITSYNEVGNYYAVTVTATDDAGNPTVKDDTDGVLGNSLKLTVKEKVKPTITLITPSSGARITNASPTISFQLRDEVNGSGIDISSLVLKIDGGVAIANVSVGMTPTSVAGGYNCDYVVQSGLAEGAHTISIDATDFDGNTALQLSSSFTVDTVAPTLDVTSPTVSLLTNNASLTVIGTTNDVTSSPVTVTISLNAADQGLVTVNAGSFSKAITLAEGINTVVIRSTDSAGKFTEITRTVTLDTVAPTISAVTITPNPVDAGLTYIVAVTVSD